MYAVSTPMRIRAKLSNFEGVAKAPKLVILLNNYKDNNVTFGHYKKHLKKKTIYNEAIIDDRPSLAMTYL